VDLAEAVMVVWDDVAEWIIKRPTCREAVDYARHELAEHELALVRDYARGDVDVYGAYLAVRAADARDVESLADERDARQV